MATPIDDYTPERHGSRERINWDVRPDAWQHPSHLPNRIPPRSEPNDVSGPGKPVSLQ